MRTCRLKLLATAAVFAGAVGLGLAAAPDGAFATDPVFDEFEIDIGEEDFVPLNDPVANIQGGAAGAPQAPPSAGLPDWLDVFSDTGPTDTQGFSPPLRGGLRDSGGTPDPDFDEVYGGAAAVFINDPTSLKGNKDSTTFAESNKNNDLISTWNWDTGNNPPKDDVFNAYTYWTVSQANGDLMAYVGIERLAEEGDSHLDVEFNQAAIGLDKDPECLDDETDGPADGAPCEFTGEKTVGDILAVMDFERGGVLGFVELRIWDGTQYVLAVDLPGEGCTTGVFSDDLCAHNNSTDIAAGPWLTIDRFGNKIQTHEANGFTEVGVNVTQILEQFGLTPGCFGTVQVKSRTSQSFNSELKDFGLAPLGLCSAELTKVCTASFLEDTGTGQLLDPLTLKTLIEGDFANTGAISLDITLVDDPAVDGDLDVRLDTDDDGIPDDPAFAHDGVTPFTVAAGQVGDYAGMYATIVNAANCTDVSGDGIVPDETGCFVSSKIGPGASSAGKVTVTSQDQATLTGFLDFQPGDEPELTVTSIDEGTEEPISFCTAMVDVNADIAKACTPAGFGSDGQTPTFEIDGGGGNTGDVPVTILALEDDLDPLVHEIVAGSVFVCLDQVAGPRPCTGEATLFVDGGDNLNLGGGFDVPAGASYGYQFDTVSVGDPPSKTQDDTMTVTANAADDILAFDTDFTRSASLPQACENVALPQISVTKDCTIVNNSGESLTVNVSGDGDSNGSNVNLANVTLTDAPPLDTLSITVDGVGAVSNGFDLPKDTGYDYTGTIALANPQSLVACDPLGPNAGKLCVTHSDTMTVTAVDAVDGQAQDDDSDDATCEIPLDPGIDVTKVCDPATGIINGDTLRVFVSGAASNDGDEKLNSVLLADTPALDVLNVDAGTNGSFMLAVGGSTNWDGRYDTTSVDVSMVTMPSAGSLGGVVKATDTMNVSATSAITASAVSDTSGPVTCEAPVNAALSVTKDCADATTGDTTIPIWGTVTANAAGNLDIEGITVTDDPVTAITVCAADTNANNVCDDGNNIAQPFDLAPGQTVFYSGSVQGQGGSNTDTITAAGTAALVNKLLTAQDSATCIVPNQGCSPGYWKNHEEQWDGNNPPPPFVVADATSTIKTFTEWNADLGIPSCAGFTFNNNETVLETMNPSTFSNDLFHLSACLTNADALGGFPVNLATLLADMQSACTNGGAELQALISDCKAWNKDDGVNIICPLN